jgi:hypothetical protein
MSLRKYNLWPKVNHLIVFSRRKGTSSREGRASVLLILISGCNERSNPLDRETSDLQERIDSNKMDKLERLRKAISARAYVINTEEVARRLIEYVLQLSLPDQASSHDAILASQAEKDQDVAIREMSDRPAQTS